MMATEKVEARLRLFFITMVFRPIKKADNNAKNIAILNTFQCTNIEKHSESLLHRRRCLFYRKIKSGRGYNTGNCLGQHDCDLSVLIACNSKGSFIRHMG